MPNVLVCSYLEPELIERIRAVDPAVCVTFEPSLVGAPRYAADHVGVRFERDEAQRAAWSALLRAADVLFDFDYLDPTSLLRDGQRVRWVQASSAGIGEMVRRFGLDASPAVFTTAAGVHARPLAEFVLWGMLAFAKEYPTARRQQREGRWARFAGSDLEGATLAVVGLGAVGREVARLASLLGVRVVGSKRSVDGIDPATLHVERLYPMSELGAMVREADYVCVATPHTPETVGVLDEHLPHMRQGCVLINIGRGSAVGEAPLLHALEHGPLRGAALDVTPIEPLPEGHALWSMNNVIVFPHSASTSVRENERLVDLFTDNLSRFLAGTPLRNVFEAERHY